MVIPVVSEFEGNYTGQFLTIFGPETEVDGSLGDVHEECDDVPWPQDATETTLGQLSDRRSDTPTAVRLPVYMDSRQTNLLENARFVVNDAS